MPFVLLLLALGFGGEIGGAVAGVVVSLILDPTTEPSLLLPWLLGMLCAIIGAFIAFKIVGPLETKQFEGRLVVRDRDIPILKERWNDRNTMQDDRREPRHDGDEKYKPGSR